MTSEVELMLEISDSSFQPKHRFGHIQDTLENKLYLDYFDAHSTEMEINNFTLTSLEKETDFRGSINVRN